MMRPFCLVHPERAWQDKQDAFFLGDDVLVYPVMRPRLRHMRIKIPAGEWTGLFDGKTYGPGDHQVDCPIGQPVALYRRGSAFEPIFQIVRKEVQI